MKAAMSQSECSSAIIRKPSLRETRNDLSKLVAVKYKFIVAEQRCHTVTDEYW